MEKYLKQNIIIAIDKTFCKNDNNEFDFVLHILPSIYVEHYPNDTILDMAFLGWTKVHFCWLCLDFNINIKNGR